MAISQEFQANQCGIETATHTCMPCETLLFQANQCGIETNSFDLFLKGLFQFQANQCGIETIFRLYLVI